MPGDEACHESRLLVGVEHVRKVQRHAEIGQNWGGLDAAYARLERHSKEMSVDAEDKTPRGRALKRTILENRMTTAKMRQLAAPTPEQGQEVRIAPNLTSGTGGDFTHRRTHVGSVSTSHRGGVRHRPSRRATLMGIV